MLAAAVKNSAEKNKRTYVPMVLQRSVHFGSLINDALTKVSCTARTFRGNNEL
jgi:hypothetical protein